MNEGHKKPTQAQQVLALLRLRGPQGLTALEALERIGCFRLASRVHELVEEGHNIESTMVAAPTTGKRIARYVLHEAPPITTGEQPVMGL